LLHNKRVLPFANWAAFQNSLIEKNLKKSLYAGYIKIMAHIKGDF
jgi:hypothetical protein